MSRFTLSRIPSLRPRQAGVGSVTPPSPRGRRLPPRATRWPLAKAGAPSVVAVPSERRAGPSGPASTAGSVPAAAEPLQAELRELFRRSPSRIPVTIARIVLAHGVVVSSAELDVLSARGLVSRSRRAGDAADAQRERSQPSSFFPSAASRAPTRFGALRRTFPLTAVSPLLSERQEAPLRRLPNRHLRCRWRPSLAPRRGRPRPRPCRWRMA